MQVPDLVNFYKNVPISNEADVIVVGGGSAGAYAAISSAREGARTILIEKNGMLGGTITTAYVNFPGLFYAWGRQIIGGPCWESMMRVKDLGGLTLPEFTDSHKQHWKQQLRLNRFIYTAVLDEMCLESGVILRLHTMVSDVVRTDGGLIVLVTGKEGLSAVRCRVIIDATGDANITEMLGYPCLKSDNLQPVTLMNKIDGFDLKDVDLADLKERIKEAVDAGKLLPSDFPDNTAVDNLVGRRINMHIAKMDAFTSEQKTITETEARKTLLRIVSFLKTVPGLENLYVRFVAEECGIRETRRIAGEKTITRENYMSGKVYDDAVCYSFYPIDLHVPTGIEITYLDRGVVPTIPYGALIPVGSDRILAAGRCISGDTDSNSSYRVQAPCMATGQAAGIAAAIAAKQNVSVRNVDYSTLCSRLRKQGAIVPEK